MTRSDGEQGFALAFPGSRVSDESSLPWRPRRLHRLTVLRRVVAALVVAVILLGSTDARAGFTITEVTPKFQWNNERLPLLVTKLAFCVEGFFPADGIEVALTRAGEADIVGSNPDFGLGELFAEFDLTAVRAGWWDAIIDHPILGTFTLVDAFFVKDAPEFKRLSAWGGPVQAVEVQGNLAYVARGSGLVILDVSDPTNMVELGSVDLRCSGVTDLAMKDHYAFVTSRDPCVGLSIVDVADPANPETIATGLSPDISGEECGTQLFGLWGIQITGNTAYVFHSPHDTGGPHHWWALDVSDPETLDAATAPFVVICFATGGMCKNTRFTIDEDDHYLYMIEYVPDAPTNSYRLTIFDISVDPFSPLVVGATSLFLSQSFMPTSVALEGDLVVVSAVSGSHEISSRLLVVNVANPLHPFLNGVYEGFSTWGPRGIHSVVLAGGLAYVADLDKKLNIQERDGLHIVDVASDPTEPTLLGTMKTRGPVYGVTMAASRVYLFDRGDGVVAVEVSDPTDPILLGNWYSPGVFASMASEGATLVLNDLWSGLTTLDMDDPSTPTLKGYYQPQGIDNTDGGWFLGDVKVQDGYAFLSTPFNGLNILDIAGAGAPVLVGHHPAGSMSAGGSPLAVKDDLLLAVTFDGNSWKVTAFDVSDPTQPVIATPDIFSPAQDTIEISDGSLAVCWTDGGCGHTIHDVTDPYDVVTLDGWCEHNLDGCNGQPGWWDDIVIEGSRIYGIDKHNVGGGVGVYGELGIDPFISRLACLDLWQPTAIDVKDGIMYLAAMRLDEEDELGNFSYGGWTLHAIDVSQIDNFDPSIDASGPIIASAEPFVREAWVVHVRGTYIHVCGPPNSQVAMPGVLTFRVATLGSSGSIDGDVDLSDFADFQNCFSGAGVSPAESECLIHDFDDDGDVDHADYAAWHAAMTGAFLGSE